MKLRPIGDIHIPKELEHLIKDDPPTKFFGPRELKQFDKIFNHLRKGWLVAVSGPWDNIMEIIKYLRKKKDEFSTTGARRSMLKDERQWTRPWFGRHFEEVLGRVLVLAKDDYVVEVDPDGDLEQPERLIRMPYLPELLGEPTGSFDGLFLVPVTTIQDIQKNMRQRFYISALNLEMIAHNNVLLPFSQDTIMLFRDALEEISQELPESAEILDMGCGCGVLSLLAAGIFSDRKAKITATDILPEAIATTKLNIELHLADMVGDSVIIETTNGGDLFGPLSNRRFDLIIFNVPWVVARPRSRAEIGTYDEDQSTLRSFLSESPNYLKDRGRIVLGYSDHSGQKAIDGLEEFIKDSGLMTENVYKKRVQSRHGSRKWETIMVYSVISEQ